ncbi:MAG: AMP-binding protein, partial [Pseudomonadota bacterium]
VDQNLAQPALQTVMEDLRELGPSYYFAPPRVFENLLTTVMIRIEDAGLVKRRLFHHFIDHARRMAEAEKAGRAPGLPDRLQRWLGEILIYGPLKNILGLSRVRVAYTAGEAIGPDLFNFYRSIGINLKQLYGQTEASVFITQHPDDAVALETVGVPTPGVEIRIGESGEVFYRSPGVFQEYFKNAEATADTKDPEGWVATGDAGFMDPETGQLRILDRAKDVGKLASGGLFAPKYIENKLKFWPNILEAVVFGHERESCMAMINIDLNSVGNWAERNNISYGSYQELSQHPEVARTIAEHMRDTNRALAEDPMLGHCQVTRFLVLHKELDADDGELTRTRKVRRRTIAEKYADLVEALYGGAGEIATETEVTYEDGRKGRIAATLAIHDVQTFTTALAEKVAAE